MAYLSRKKPSIRSGEEIDGFVIGERLHRGGMATLWSVSHPEIATPLLMKIPVVSEGEDPAAIVSFEMEQMILPRISGPHVPRCFGTGDFAREPYVVIERLPGQTLYARLGDLPLGYEQAGGIAGKIAAALADLHRQNVIHHDIKPSSIMFRESGEAVLIDFGLSHHNQLPDLLQEEFRVPFGTAPYMAPERLLGVRDDPRSDIFSLGVLLYFFTTGVRPFDESETMRGMRRRLWRDPYPPRQLSADYPPWLQEIVLRCLEIEPTWRYPTASQLAFELAHPDQVKLTARFASYCAAPEIQWRREFAETEIRSCRAAGFGSDRGRRAGYRGGIEPAERGAAYDRGTNPGEPAIGQARLPQCPETRPHHHRPHARCGGQQQAHRPPGRAAALGLAIQAG